MKQWVDFAIATYKHIDILYNNAPSPKFAPIEQMTEEEWRFTNENFKSNLVCKSNCRVHG